MRDIIKKLYPRTKYIKSILADYDREELEWMLATMIIAGEYAANDQAVVDALESTCPGSKVPDNVMEATKDLTGQMLSYHALQQIS